MTKPVAIPKPPPVTREELISAFRGAEVKSPGAARTLTEITAWVASRRGQGDVGLRGYHVAPMLQELLATPDCPIVKAVGSQVRFFAVLPPRLGHTTAYYVWRTQAARYKAKYDELLRQRAATISAADQWQTALGKHGVARAADATVIIELPPTTAVAILAASKEILSSTTTTR